MDPLSLLFQKREGGPKKQADYTLFKSAYYLIKNKSHLTNKGILELVALKAVLNRGLSKNLGVAFPDIVPALRPEVSLSKFVDPYWLVGFTDAEGCFSVVIFKSLTSKLPSNDFVVGGCRRKERLLN